MANIPASKKPILQQSTFGQRIAEDESEELKKYFVETEQWQRIYSGDIDVIYGPKGAGKSAIYSLLLNRGEDLHKRRVYIKAAENPRGTPVFKDLVGDPPLTEIEFISLWKVYFLSLLGTILRENDIINAPAVKAIALLEDAQLLPKTKNLKTFLSNATEFVSGFFKISAIEGGVTIEPTTGLPVGVTGKISLQEPTMAQRNLGVQSADTILDLIDEAFIKDKSQAWLALDRLDVAFADTEELEASALRALFRVYLDLAKYDNISLKIFLRNDIWKRITSQGFREASHITKHLTIVWNKENLLNLLIRRIFKNDSIQSYYGLNQSQLNAILGDMEQQEKLFYRVFPDQVNVGPNKPKTLDWMLSRTRDAGGANAPRELIHFLTSAKEVMLRKLDIGAPEPLGEQLFDRVTLRESIPEVGQVKLEQTLYAEYPDVKDLILMLEGEKTQQNIESLANLWHLSREEALKMANKISDIGFFEKRGTKDNPIFWVPFLFRDSLKMVQGTAVAGTIEAGDEEV